MRRSAVSVSCPVSSSKLVFISVRTWRAIGASSCTAFSKWASLSFRLAEPPCVPSRRSSKCRMRLVIYAGIAPSGIAHLLLRLANSTFGASPETLAQEPLQYFARAVLRQVRLRELQMTGHLVIGQPLATMADQCVRGD